MSEDNASQSTDRPEILVIDDSRVIRKAATKMLGDGYVVHEAVDGNDGWQQLQKNDAISVVFTDMQMPEMNGMELLSKIRGCDDERIAAIPVIMITGQGDTEETKREVFDAGATDFITKPFGSIDLLSRAKSYAQLNRKVVELEKQTGHDKLTGLFNANSLQEQGDKAVSFSVRHKADITAVYLEIDGFQELFLKYGKTVAQLIIVTVAKRLGTVLRNEDVAARVGVAKYALLLPQTNSTQARIVVDRVRETINKLVFDTGKEKIRAVLAAGITSPEISDELTFADMLAQSDVALKRAIEKAGDKIASFVEQKPAVEEQQVEEVVEIPETVSEEDLLAAFKLVLQGDYYKIEQHHLDSFMERLAPFLEYVHSQDKERTGTE